MPPEIVSLSKEYVYVPVKAGVDLAALPVEVALTTNGAEPVGADWRTAAWDQGRARVLVGPLPDGRYSVWVRVTATPEVPVMKAGLLDVT